MVSLLCCPPRLCAYAGQVSTGPTSGESARALSGDGANPERALAEEESATPEPSAVAPVSRDGGGAEETPTEGQQLRLL